MTEPNFPSCFKQESKPHKFCPGCGHPIVLGMLGRVVDELGIADRTIFLVDIGCSLLAWDFFNLPTTQTHHGRTTPVAVGFKIADPKKIVIAYMGDGGGYAIGLQHTIHSCLRNNPITTILVNNTLYGMTGGQSAPTSVEGEMTTTNLTGNVVEPLRGPELLNTLAQKNAYIARGSIGQPLVLKQYLQKAIQAQQEGNYAFVEALSVCPLNWKTNASETIQRNKELEETFPLGEFTR